MFFSRSLKKKLLHAEKTEQRQYLYSRLHSVLHERELSLVWPINQAIDPKNKKMKGYCHGYNEVWTKHLLEAGTDEPFFSEDSWSALIKSEEYDFSSMPLSPNIKFKQAIMPSGIGYRAQGKAVHCDDYRQLIEEILERSLRKLYLESCEGQQHVFVVCLGSVIEVTQEDICFPFLPLSARSKSIQWHEARLCLDAAGHVHWFDANAGWFRSQTTKPAIDDLKKDLSLIFEALQYPENILLPLYLRFTKNKLINHRWLV